MNAPFWISLGTNLACFCIMAGACFDIERLVKRCDALEDRLDVLEQDVPEIRTELVLLKRHQRPRPAADTGPIPVNSTPVPSTVTGIPSARPEVPRTGSTAAGRHRKAS